jgi:hypothetical protein
MKMFINLITAFLLLSSFTARAQTGAYGVSFDAPEGWTVNKEVDPSWTKFKLLQSGGVPRVMIQIYSSNVSPVSVLDAYVNAHRTKYRDNHWQFTQSPTHETFGNRFYNGRQLIYTANGTTYCQRFFGLTVNQRTVLVMSLVQVQENWNYWGYGNEDIPDVLGPIAGSLR